MPRALIRYRMVTKTALTVVVPVHEAVNARLEMAIPIVTPYIAVMAIPVTMAIVDVTMTSWLTAGGVVRMVLLLMGTVLLFATVAINVLNQDSVAASLMDR